MFPKVSLLISGEERFADRDVIDVNNPSTGELLGTIPKASSSDIQDAIAAATKGFAEWRAVAPDRRADILIKAARLLRDRAEDYAAVLTQEQGKLLSDSKAEILRAAEIIEWDAQEGRRIYGRVVPSSPDMRFTILRQPIGVVAAFSPWNFPFGSPCRKLSGALAAGCSVILKPSEETPASGFLLAKAFLDAGVPPAAIGVLYGDPSMISQKLIADPAVRLVAFTGSVPVGKLIAGEAAKYPKPAILELGGHGPVIVCADADPVAVAKAAVQAKTRSSGQICTAPTRFYIDSAIYERFVSAFADAASQINLGDGMLGGSAMGPLVNKRRVAVIEDMVEDARKRGARVVAGGQTPEGQGAFYPLTVIADVPSDALAMTEEPFGPIALLSPFDDIDEAITKANDLPYGLAAYAFTQSLDLAHELIERIECGNFSLNHFGGSTAATPLGGVKESGYGREGGTEGLLHYTTVKAVSQLVRARGGN